jgi:hypothetical protein
MSFFMDAILLYMTIGQYGCRVIGFRDRFHLLFRNSCGSQTTKFSSAIYQGYSTITNAEQAFRYAKKMRWTRSGPLTEFKPAEMPRPITSAYPDDTFMPRSEDDYWYVSLRGNMPGVYGTWSGVESFF